MIFTHNSGQSVELSLLGYAYPDANPDVSFHDSNWLNVRVRVNTQQKSWSVVENAMQTFEVERLAALLRDWSCNRRLGVDLFVITEQSFAVRLLSYTKDTKAMRIELRDAFSLNATEINVDWQYPNESLNTLADHLETELKRFPVRHSAPCMRALITDLLDDINDVSHLTELFDHAKRLSNHAISRV